MLIAPEKILISRLLKGRTFNFDSVRRTHGNMIIIPTLKENEMFDVISSKLFRPIQLMSLYIPRIIKPAGRAAKVVKQAEYYKNVKSKTNGKIKYGKTSIPAYSGRNLVYDISSEYSYTLNVLSQTKQNIALEMAMKKVLEDKIRKLSNDSDYPNSYIVFPVDEFMEGLSRKDIMTKAISEFSFNPLILFLRSYAQGTIDKSAYKNIKGIFFYNPNADVLISFGTIDNEETSKNFQVFIQKFLRLNNFNGKLDSLDDAEVDEDNNIPEELSDEDSIENKKEEIKEVIFNKIGKNLKANLSDYEAATKDEQELIVSIDQKIESILSSPEEITFDGLVNKVETDNDLKKLAIKYIENKKNSQQKTNQLSKNLDKEAEILDKIPDLSAEDEIVEPKKVNVATEFLDERIKSSVLGSIDAEYEKKQAKKDLINVLSAFSASPYIPMTIDSLEIVDSSDDFDFKDTIKIRYKTDEGNSVSFQLDIPKVIDDRYYYLGGNKKIMNRQLIRLPIIKTKVDRVEITSAFNKMTIERSSGKLSRKNAYLLKYLEKARNNPAYTIVYGSNSVINSKYKNDFEFEELANALNEIKTVKYELLFNRDILESKIEILNLPDNFLGETKTPVGFEIVNEKSDLLYIENEELRKVSVNDDGELDFTNYGKSYPEFILNDVLGHSGPLPQIGKSFIYTKVKFLATTYPIFAVVGLTNGITDILKRYNIEYFLSDKAIRKRPDLVEVRFKDKFLYYKDTIKNTLLLNALYLMDTESYKYSDFDLNTPYNDFFISKLGSSVGVHTKNTLKINLAVMLDPITKDVLKDLKLPTDITDLLLYANTMLTDSSYKPQNDLTNYRLRGNESLYSVLYKIIANAYVSYQRHRLNGRPLNIDIPKNKLISEFLTQNIVGEFSFLNPSLEIEGLTWTSAKGPSGINLNKAYTLEMRTYDDSMVGYLSGNSTPYSGSAGITRSLTYDPKISNVRGYIVKNDINELSAANMLSPVELLAPFTSAGADPARQAMQVSQTKHIMPTVQTSKQLIGSGISKTLPYLLTDAFVFKAKKNGFVKKIDKTNKLAILQYSDGELDAIDLAATLSKNSNSGFFIEQNFIIVYEEGERFSKNDVIAYNPDYFTGKGNDAEYKQGVLAKIAIAAGDFSFEDSTLISEKLSKKCASYVVMEKAVSLGPHAIIHNIAHVGDSVKTNDHLLDFTASFASPETSDFLQNLANQLDPEAFESIIHESVKSKYTGDLVDIKIYYNTPFENLSPSLQNLIMEYSKRIELRKKALAGVKTGSVHVPPIEQVHTDKIGKTEFDPDGGVIIQFFIKYKDSMGPGAKLTYATALKGVVSLCLPEDESPVSEYRPEEVIEGVITPTGIIGRLTSDIYKLVFSNKVLVELGKQIREIYEDKR